MQQAKVKTKLPRTKKGNSQLTPRQLRRLADRMVASTDPVEITRLKKDLERGFYGDPSDA